ncbi:MAG: esterase-like activity of phytase family protein [Capsulimonas sp.]|uniref:esterase-like activity of phytase family protein n=1 Tax=Capsulimonas sp. TaxID=2494211 RepID=UPI003267E6B2
MNSLPRPALLGAAALALLSAFAQPVHAEVVLLGSASIPGTATDLSGLTGPYTPNGADIKAQLGAFGSGIAYTGSGNQYIAVNDRGFSNGEAHYDDRIQIFEILTNAATKTVTPTLLKTVLLRDEQGRPFTGFSGDIGTAAPRLDPEGVRVSRDGNLFISDEYGPSIYEFAPSGKRIRTLQIPAKFAIAHPDADGDKESQGNTTGRVANRGMEGLAITPDGNKLYGILQSPLLQDHALSSDFKKDGVNNRILCCDLKTNKTREFLYPMDDKKNGVNEILAVNDHQFLAIERDGKGAADAGFKKIFLIDIAGATDISSIASLPARGAPDGVKPVRKSLFIDLLSPKFGLATPDFPEKIEGIAFGPDAATGKHQLIVTSDNDLISTQPSWFYVFTFDDSDLKITPQKIDKAFATKG